MTERERTAAREMERISAQELRALKPAQVLAIDRALANLGAFGEVHIIKRQNRVRFMKTTESTDLLKIGGGRGDS